MDNSSKLKKMKNENNKFMPFLIILVPLVLMKLTLMIMKNILKYKNNNTNLFSKKKKNRT
jgi:hypothetical protein